MTSDAVLFGILAPKGQVWPQMSLLEQTVSSDPNIWTLHFPQSTTNLETVDHQLGDGSMWCPSPFGVPHPPTVETGRDLDSRPEPGECPRARPVSVRAYPAAQPFRRHENSRFLRILTDYRLSPFFGLDTNMEKHHKVCTLQVE